MLTISLGRDPSIQQAIIPGLTPYTKYEVMVNPFNKVGPGPASSKTIVSTLEGGECDNRLENLSSIIR